jgi:sugar phosphate isomerase/epimerase
MAQIPIGVQLYSVREDAKNDLPGVLEAIGKMGYDGVEFAGYYGHSAEQIKQWLDDNGLQCCGTHTGLQTLTGDELQKTIDFNMTLGNPYLIVPGLPGERTGTRTAWLETAQIFNDISAKVRVQDCWVGYHNHHTEFQPLDGEMPWDTFFGNTVKDVVMQLDSGNALHGGADIVPFLERYPGRALTVHLKEYDPDNNKALIGEGQVRWNEIFDLCERSGNTQWYIVEQESYAFPPMECIDKCLRKLREMGK